MDGSGAKELWGGVARVDITDNNVGKCNDPLYVKALVLRNNSTMVVIITVDAVAIAEIGSIGNDYLEKVRSYLQKELNIKPENVLINASHCHGVVCEDVVERTLQAVKEAYGSMVPVNVAVGRGHEDRIMENRRLKLKSGKEADVRRAYPLPPDEEVHGIGPVDPEIGILRLDRRDGRTLAVLYNFACHPIQGVPSGGNTADLIGFASKVIESNLGHGAIALFLQGCAGDINPIFYKDVNRPRDAEPLGNMLGFSLLQALKEMQSRNDGRLRLIREVIKLPRADLAQSIHGLEVQQIKLLGSLKGTSLNFKKFLPLLVKYSLFPDYPSYDSHGYLHAEMLGRDHWGRLDADNRREIEAYLENIYTMEQLTRNQVNLELLKMHHAQNMAAGDTIDVEVLGLRIGDFVLVTFPGELSVEIGLNIKRMSPHGFTFVAGYTNGYIYYAPTSEQLKNRGGAQEDSDCLLAPEWQQIYEGKVKEILCSL